MPDSKVLQKHADINVATLIGERASSFLATGVKTPSPSYSEQSLAMKINLPVSQTEHPYPRDRILVSRTDLKGITTYANDAFIEISGYSREELIGKNHNVVRHPDMPPEAFKDLWTTVKAGDPWRGVVKNRCKNGDYYWVDALVVPIHKNGQLTGYMSVRRQPSREQVEGAEALYRRVREKQAQLAGTGAGFINNLSIKTRFTVFVGIMALLLVAVGVSGLRGMSHSNEALGITYRMHLEPFTMMGRILLLTADNRANVMLGLQHNPENPLSKSHDHPLSTHTDAISRNAEEIDRLWKEITTRNLGTEEQKLAENAVKTRGDYVKEGIFPAREALLAGDYARAETILLAKVNPLYKKAEEDSSKLMQAVLNDARSGFERESARFSTTRNLTIVAILVALALAALATVLIVRGIIRPLNKAVGYFHKIAEGNLNNDIEIGGRDEVGRVLASLAATQVHLRVIIDEIRLSVQDMHRRCGDLETEMTQVTANSQEQRDRVIQVSAAMEEVSVSVSEVASGAGSAAAAAKTALTTVNEGGTQMARNMESSQKVISAVQTSSQAIHQLDQALQKIGSVTQVIKDIADQTNLLALNAAIEAARAGEQGRGFAVVADEVRRLAERTTASTADITKMVDEIQKTTLSAVGSMDEVVQEVEAGREMLQSSHDSFNKITSSSEEVTHLAEHIAGAATEQSKASEEVANNMEKMSTLIDKNTASLKQVEHAMHELAATERELQEVVAHFEAAA